VSAAPSLPSAWRDLALQVALAARAHTVPRFGAALAVHDKGGHAFDPVTDADRDAERAMRALLEREVPDHGIHGEEHGMVREGARWRWVLDPIDGTRAFISGFPTWVTLVGLLCDGEPVLGVIDAPAAGLLVVGWTRPTERGPAAAELHDRGGVRPIRARGCPSLDLATLSTTSPDLFTSNRHRRGWAAARTGSKLQRYGGDGLAYALIAAGLVDGVVETGLQAYDLVAPLAVVRAAGGVATSVDGGDPLADGTVIAAGDPAVHAALLACFA
jgi:myo-inositol-1(or 4)-monophosphatase